MISFIKSLFSKKKYYLKVVNPSGDITWLCEFSDIIKLMSMTSEAEILSIEGKCTLVVGRR